MELYYLYFIFISHVLSCIFIFLGTATYPNWITAGHYENSTFLELYINSFYFNHTTIFTVGYGDILSKNYLERTYNILLMIVGIMLYSFALTSISNIVKMNDEKRKIFENKKRFLNKISEKYFINKKLYGKLSRHLFHELKNSTMPVLSFINELPTTLQNEMILNMHRKIINSFKFFKDCYDNDLIIQAIVSLKPATTTKNEILVKKGDIMEEVLFIKMGKIQLEVLYPIINNNQHNKYSEQKNINLRANEKGIDNSKNKNSIIKNCKNLNEDLFHSKEREDLITKKIKSSKNVIESNKYSFLKDLIGDERKKKEENCNEKNNSVNLENVTSHDYINKSEHVDLIGQTKNEFYKFNSINENVHGLNKKLLTSKKLLFTASENSQKKSYELNKKIICDFSDQISEKEKHVNEISQKSNAIIIEEEYKQNQEANTNNIITFKKKHERVKILHIRQNEHFGVSLVIDNLKSPFNIRTDSKTAELFILHKIDLIALFQTNHFYMQQIYEKSNYNLIKSIQILHTKKNKKMISHPYDTMESSSEETNNNCKNANQEFMEDEYYASSGNESCESYDAYNKNKKEALEIIQESIEGAEQQYSSSRNKSSFIKQTEKTCKSNEEILHKNQENEINTQIDDVFCLKTNIDARGYWTSSLNEEKSLCKLPRHNNNNRIPNSSQNIKNEQNSIYNSENSERSHHKGNKKFSICKGKKFGKGNSQIHKNKLEETLMTENRTIRLSPKTNPHVMLSPKSNFIHDMQLNRQNVDYINSLRHKFTKMMHSERKIIKKKNTHLLKPKSSHENFKNSKYYRIPAQTHKNNEVIFFDSTNFHNLEGLEKQRKKRLTTNKIFPESISPSSESNLDRTKISYMNKYSLLNNFNANLITERSNFADVPDELKSHFQFRHLEYSGISSNIAHEHIVNETFLKIKNNRIKNIFPIYKAHNQKDSLCTRGRMRLNKDAENYNDFSMHSMEKLTPKLIKKKSPNSSKRALSLANTNHIRDVKNIRTENINIKTYDVSKKDNLNIFLRLPDKNINKSFKKDKNLNIKVSTNEFSRNLINLNNSGFFNSELNDSIDFKKSNQDSVLLSRDKTETSNPNHNNNYNINMSRSRLNTKDVVNNNYNENFEIALCYKCKTELTEKFEKIKKEFFEFYENKKYSITNENCLSILASTTDESEAEHKDKQNDNSSFNIKSTRKEFNAFEHLKTPKCPPNLGIEFDCTEKNNVKKQSKNTNKIDFHKITINESIRNNEIMLSPLRGHKGNNFNNKYETKTIYSTRSLNLDFFLSPKKTSKKHPKDCFFSNEISKRLFDCDLKNNDEIEFLNCSNRNSNLSNNEDYNTQQDRFVSIANYDNNIHYDNIGNNFLDVNHSPNKSRNSKHNIKLNINNNNQSANKPVYSFMPMGNMNFIRNSIGSNRLSDNPDFFRFYESNMKDQLLSLSKHMFISSLGKASPNHSNKNNIKNEQDVIMLREMESDSQENYASPIRSKKHHSETLNLGFSNQAETLSNTKIRKSSEVNLLPQKKPGFKRHESDKKNQKHLPSKLIEDSEYKRVGYSYMNVNKFDLESEPNTYYNRYKNSQKLELNLNIKLERIINKLKI